VFGCFGSNLIHNNRQMVLCAAFRDQNKNRGQMSRRHEISRPRGSWDCTGVEESSRGIRFAQSGSSYLLPAKCATSDSSGYKEADDVLKRTSSSKGIDDAAIVDCRGYSSHGRLRWRFDTDRKSEPSPSASPCTRSCGTPYSDSEHRFSWWRLLVEVHFCGLCLQRSNAK
jgi:hypothetical protein